MFSTGTFHHISISATRPFRRRPPGSEEGAVADSSWSPHLKCVSLALCVDVPSVRTSSSAVVVIDEQVAKLSRTRGKGLDE